MKPHPDHERHQRLPDVPRLRATDERAGLQAHCQHDLDDEPHLTAGPHRLFHEQSALLGFTKALALELAPDAITVNGISPGPCTTEINKALMENAELTQFFLSRIPVGRWGKVEEIGQLAVYLCSEAAGFITGTDIVIDGGWTAQ